MTAGRSCSETLASLERACDRAVIVLGFAAEEIRASIEQHYQGPMALIFALNNRYHLANGLSVLAAREYVQGDFLLCMADHIMDDAFAVPRPRHRTAVRWSGTPRRLQAGDDIRHGRRDQNPGGGWKNSRHR